MAKTELQRSGCGGGSTAALLADGLLGDHLFHHRELGALALRLSHLEPNPNNRGYLALVTGRQARRPPAGATAGSGRLASLSARRLRAAAADCGGRAGVAASAVGGSPSPARGEWATGPACGWAAGRAVAARLGVCVRLCA